MCIAEDVARAKKYIYGKSLMVGEVAHKKPATHNNKYESSSERKSWKIRSLNVFQKTV